MNSSIKPYISFFIISFLAIAAGIYIYSEQSIKIKSEIYSQLTYISNIKRDQISSWLYSRVNDSYTSSYDKYLMRDIDTYLQNKGDLRTENRVKSWFAGLKNNPNYIDAYLLDPRMEVRLFLNSRDYFNDIDKKYLDSSLKTGYSVLADFHRSAKNKIHMGIVTPLFADTDSDKKIIGLLLQIIDPEISLFPLVSSWPTETKTAETLIIRAEGDSVLFLNELRHKKNTAMVLKVSVTKTNIPAVRAVRGYSGIFEGTDYRGVPVLSYLSKIEGSNWFMVTKVDIDEALAPLQNSYTIIILTVLFFIFLSGITIAYLWKKQESSYFEEKYALQKSAEESAKKSLKEKEVLLKELNHRTKNNMQIISSLISLKASSLEDENHILSLTELQFKILAISLVHEKLQLSENLSVIDLKDYLSELILIIIKGFSDNQNKIELKLQLDNVDVNIDTAISCGLIINELISNSIKYAFPGGARGIIKVDLQEKDDQLVELRVADNGISYKEDALENTLGLKLFRNIAEGQLMAKVDVDKSEGVEYTILFRKPA